MKKTVFLTALFVASILVATAQDSIAISSQQTQKTKGASIVVTSTIDGDQTDDAADTTMSVNSQSISGQDLKDLIRDSIDEADMDGLFPGLFGIGTGIGIAILTIIGIFFMPFIAIIAIIVLVLSNKRKRERARYELYARAMEKGVDIPKEVLDQPHKFIPRPLLSKGISNAAIGLGLFSMFMFWDWDGLAGIAAIPFFIGVGQIIYYFLYEKSHPILPPTQPSTPEKEVKTETETPERSDNNEPTI